MSKVVLGQMGRFGPWIVDAHRPCWGQPLILGHLGPGTTLDVQVEGKRLKSIVSTQDNLGMSYMSGASVGITFTYDSNPLEEAGIKCVE